MTYPLLPLHIDSTMLTCFRSCPQKYLLEFVQGFRPPGLSIDLHAGACFAAALEEVRKQVYMNGKSLPEALLIAEARFFTDWGDVEVPEWKKTAKTKDRVWEAVVGDGTTKGEGYFQRYQPLTDRMQPYYDREGKPTFEYTFAIPLEPCIDPKDFEPVGYERWIGKSGTQFERAKLSLDKEGNPNFENTTNTQMAPPFPAHPSGGPWLYTGRFDLLGTYEGRPTPLDDKTTGGSIGQNWSETWELRNQFLGYTWACQQCGLDVEGVLVRGIAIQKTQIVHAEAFKPYSKHLIAKWYEQLRRDLWRLRRAYDERYFDYNFADACTSYGNCIFMPVCQSTNPESWLSNFEVRHWNPLLKNPVVESAK